MPHKVRFLRLEESMALLPPPLPRAPISSSDILLLGTGRCRHSKNIVPITRYDVINCVDVSENSGA